MRVRCFDIAIMRSIVGAYRRTLFQKTNLTPWPFVAVVGRHCVIIMRLLFAMHNMCFEKPRSIYSVYSEPPVVYNLCCMMQHKHTIGDTTIKVCVCVCVCVWFVPVYNIYMLVVCGGI